MLLDRNAHWEACGTAEFLMEQGHEVEFVTPLASAGVDLEPSNAALFYQRVRPRGLRITANSDIETIDGDDLVLVDVHSAEEQLRCGIDWIVLAIGWRSEDSFYRALNGRLPVFRIGDCRAPRYLEQAILEGEAITREMATRIAAAHTKPR